MEVAGLEPDHMTRNADGDLQDTPSANGASTGASTLQSAIRGALMLIAATLPEGVCQVLKTLPPAIRAGIMAFVHAAGKED